MCLTGWGPDADLLDTDRVKLATESLVWEFGSSR